MTTRIFDSIAKLLETTRTEAGQHLFSTDKINNKWYNNETLKQTLQKTLTGDTRLVPLAERELSRLDTLIETPRRQVRESVAGGWPSVPDFLAGRPTPMRVIHHTHDDSAPINIFSVTTSSAGIDAATLEKRGVVILALTMALTRVRPVALYQVAIMHGSDSSGECIFASKINTHPLDLATACYVLTSAGFDRRITHSLGHRHGFNGRWPRKFHYHSPEQYYTYLKQTLTQHLGMQERNTLVIGAAQLRRRAIIPPHKVAQRSDQALHSGGRGAITHGRIHPPSLHRARVGAGA